MAFVKLDCGILDSTLWIDRDCRDVFVTALLMAEPREIVTPLPSRHVRSIDKTGWDVPAGWYGFVPAAGIGIIRRAGVDLESGLRALERLGEPDAESRSPDYAGRRLVRVDGGYIILNFMKYRDRDYTGAERAKRYRERQKGKAAVTPSRRDVTPSHRDITQAEAEAEVEININTPLPPKGGWGACPEGVDAEAWQAWAAYKRGKPAKATVTAMANLLRAYPAETQRAMVAESVRNGWRGCFPPKTAPLRPSARDDLDAERLRRIEHQAREAGMIP